MTKNKKTSGNEPNPQKNNHLETISKKILGGWNKFHIPLNFDIFDNITVLNNVSTQILNSGFIIDYKERVLNSTSTLTHLSVTLVQEEPNCSRIAMV